MNQAAGVKNLDASGIRQLLVDGVAINADLSQRPCYIDGCDTIVKLFLKRTAELGARTAHREKLLGVWKAFSWRDYYEKARLIALGLNALGLKRGDRVSILSEDNKEWLYADIGVQALGGVSSGVYTTDSAKQLAYLINDSGSRFLFVENDEQLDKYLSIEAEVPGLAKVIVLDREGLRAFSHGRVMFLEDLYALGETSLASNPNLFEAEIAGSKPADVALLIYTSGTTGAPKGAMLTHENLVYAATSLMQSRPVKASDKQICFLPLSHIVERLFSGYFPICSRCTTSFAESTETVFDNMREVSPTVFFGVPRVWEKVYSRVRVLEQEATWLGRQAFKAATGIGLKRAGYVMAGKPVPWPVALAFSAADFFVLANLRRMLGMSRLTQANSGAAPISPELIRWYFAIGVPFYEGYGQTEGTALASINGPAANKTGTVGKALPGVEIRIADDGEIQLAGGHIFKGYWNNNQKTAEAMTADGWLRTGDVGAIDADGFLSITGRIKDIIITAGGKNITPSELENELKFSPYISDAVVIGDRRKYLTCLIMIDQENVEKFAQDNRVPFNDFASLCAAQKVKDLIAATVGEMNRKFARVEQVKDFRIIDVLLTAEDDELTATMKLKRSFVEKKYKGLIDTMYV